MTVTVAAPGEMEDDALVARASSGDAAAFTQFVTRHQRPVYALAYRMLRNAADAEDAAQETFVRAYTRLATYRPSGKFGAWLLAITANWCIDLARARRRVQTVTWGLIPESDRFLQHEEGPEARVLGRDTSDEVQGWLDALAPHYRAVLVLRYLHDLSYNEIAAAIGAPRSTVRMRLFRARQLLQTVVTRERAATQPAQLTRAAARGVGAA